MDAGRIVWIAACGGLPVKNTPVSIEGANGINVADKLMPSRQAAHHLDLQVLGRVWNKDAVVLAKALKQMNALMEQAVPGFALFVIENGIPEGPPFLMESDAGILLMEESREGLFEATAKDHAGAGFFFPPTIEVTISIAARATEVVGDLRMAEDHGSATFPPAAGAGL